MEWRPLLEGSLAAQAREAVEEVAEAVNAPTGWMPENLNDTTRVTWRAGIAAGAAGKALLYSYLALDREQGGPAPPEGATDPSETALELLDQASEALAQVPMGEGLFTGFTGIAWLNDHLRGRLYESDGDDANVEIDEALIELLSKPRPKAEFDLINGLAGVGAYALEGLPRESAARCLELAIERLDEMAERGPEGIAIFSPPESLSPYQVETYTKGFYNLGASHGLAGAVAMLGGACRAGVAEERARPLLEGAMEWLRRHQHPPSAGFCFPHFFHPEIPPVVSRIAWCYGDPGMAATLLAAARGAGVEDWETMAVDAALLAAARPEEESRIRDAGLCHGAAGIAHLFNRIYQATGEEKLADAARFWFGWALRFRQPGEGVAGFRSWTTDGEKQDWRSDPGFLEGAAGVGLALLAAISPVEPEWDRLLLAGGRLDRRT